MSFFDLVKIQKMSTKEAFVTERENGEFCLTSKNAAKAMYCRSQKYWSEIPATVNGMLGGLGYISSLDLRGSNSFLSELKIRDTAKLRALDCGAGIGRVSKHLLMPLFGKVDLVEQDATFAKRAAEYCTQDEGALPGYPSRLGVIYNVGLQEFKPQENHYDLVWSQWVLGYLTDSDLLDLFRRLRHSLKAGGYFIMKDNVTARKNIEIDEEDASVTRPLQHYEKFLKEAGFRIVKISRQKGFPKGLYPVYTIASCATTSVFNRQ